MLFATVRSTGAVMLPLAIMTLSLLLVRFPLGYGLMPRHQADAVWWSFPISSALAALLALIYYRFGNWRAARMTAPEPVAGAAAG